MFKLQDAYHCNVLVAKALNFESKSSYLLNITASNVSFLLIYCIRLERVVFETGSLLAFV